MSDINHFKGLLLCKIMLDGYWCDITWLDADADIF
jgi:hypothetical protein